MRWGFAFTLAGLVGCRSPTQIDVQVSTNVACAQVSGTSVTTGTLGEIETIPPTSTTSDCSNESIGSVVLVPSGDDGALVAFKVVTAINGTPIDTCVPDGTGSYGANCIVARRALRYLPHTALQVDVLMSGACAGKACDAQSTCVEGVCVSATIGNSASCEGSGCDENGLGSGAETPDATAPPADAGLDATLGLDAAADAASDAPTDSSFVASDASLGVVPGCDMGGALLGAAWPMEDYCPAHRNRSPLPGPVAKPTVKWSKTFGVPGSMLAAPAIGPDGTLYFGATPAGGSGTVFAVDPVSGSAVWTYSPDSGAAFPAMPILAADGTVRVSDQINGVYTALYIDGGGLKLAAPLAFANQQNDPFAVRGGATIVGNGTQYVSDVESHVLAYDSTGTVSWAVNGVSNDFIYPTVAGDGTILTVGVPVDSGIVTDFFPDGGARWGSFCGAPANLFSSVSVATDGTIRVVAENDGVLYAFKADGTYEWQASVGNDFLIPVLAIGDDGTTYVAGAGALTAWDSNGNAAGSYPGNCGQPVIDAVGSIYATCDSALVMLDSTLHAVWSLPLPVADNGVQLINDSPVIGPENRIYLSFDTENSPDGGPPETIIAVGP